MTILILHSPGPIYFLYGFISFNNILIGMYVFFFFNLNVILWNTFKVTNAGIITKQRSSIVIYLSLVIDVTEEIKSQHHYW